MRGTPRLRTSPGSSSEPPEAPRRRPRFLGRGALVAMVVVVAAGVGGVLAAGQPSVVPRVVPSGAIQYPAGFCYPVRPSVTRSSPRRRTARTGAPPPPPRRRTATTADRAARRRRDRRPPASRAWPTSTTTRRPRRRRRPHRDAAAPCGLTDAALTSSGRTRTRSRTGRSGRVVWGCRRAHNQANADRLSSGTPRRERRKAGSSWGRVPGAADPRRRLDEAVKDGGNDSKTTLAMYPKQPFNWDGRTGTCSTCRRIGQGPHAAWPELGDVTRRCRPRAHGYDRTAQRVRFRPVRPQRLRQAPSNVDGVQGLAGDDRGHGGGRDAGRLRRPGARRQPGVEPRAGDGVERQIELFMTDPGSTAELRVGAWTGLNLGCPGTGVDPGRQLQRLQGRRPVRPRHVGQRRLRRPQDLPRPVRRRARQQGGRRGDGGVNLGWRVARGQPETITVNDARRQQDARYRDVLFNSYARRAPGNSPRSDSTAPHRSPHDGCTRRLHACYSIHAVTMPLDSTRCRPTADPNRSRSPPSTEPSWPTSTWSWSTPKTVP